MMSVIYVYFSQEALLLFGIWAIHIDIRFSNGGRKMYKPHRGRFHYIHEAIFFLEDKQCGTCVFRNTEDPDYPMCVELGGQFFMEEPMPEIVDPGNEDIVCTKYRQGDPTPPEVEAQEALF
jgi:hypothetical protein